MPIWRSHEPDTRARVAGRFTRRLGRLTVVLALVAPGVGATDPLREGFEHPPREARPSMYWLWLNGYVNRDVVRQELADYRAKGIGGLCLFEMGARGSEPFVPPAGPPFLGEAFLDSLAHTLRVAEELGLEVQLATSSSWDMGGAWVEPRHASMRLYHSSVTLIGPSRFRGLPPLPSLPRLAPRGADGAPLFLQDVALLAVPTNQRQPAHEFVFRLPRGDEYTLQRFVFHNRAAEPSDASADGYDYAHRFSVAVRASPDPAEPFRAILRDELAPHREPQAFAVSPTRARYIRLRVYPRADSSPAAVGLAEFEAHSADGVNIAGSHQVDRTRDCAELVWSNSARSLSGNGAADRIHDGDTSSTRGCWISAPQTPAIIHDPESVLPLESFQTADGTLDWEVPAGEWDVLRLVCANTGERLKVPSPLSDGLATDHLSHKATRAYLETVTTRLRNRLGDLRSTPLRHLYLPSYEPEPNIWTPDFPSWFRTTKGYDITPYLPALTGCLVRDQDTTQRFRYDYEKALGLLLVEAYYAEAARVARESGLGIEAEAGGPGTPLYRIPIDALQALGAIDEVRGEFWPFRMENDNLWVVKETASAAHTYGKKRVHMEAFTGFRHWEVGPFELKPAADRAFCEGMNHVVWHTSTHQPPEAGQPGWVYGAGTHLSRNLVWWPKAKPFLDYLARSSFLLQQGRFVADVCRYYGDDPYSFVPPKHIDPSLGPGYDYDVCNREVLLERLQVHNDRLVLPDGMHYELLTLPDLEHIDLETLRRIGALVEAGATVVGPKPKRSHGLFRQPERDLAIRRLADQIWGDCDGKTVTSAAYGKGRVVWGEPLRSVLAGRGVPPDFSYTSDKEPITLDYIHRRTDTADIYFVRNTEDRSARVTARFRATGRTPACWDPATKTVDACHDARRRGPYTELPLFLDRYGSTFVVFQTNRDGPARGAAPTTKTVASVPGPWTVEFPDGRGAPASITMEKLVPWTESQDPGIRYYAGRARYHTEIVLPDDPAQVDPTRLVDLGDLWAVGEVFLNGSSCGILWKPPYRVDITPHVRPGRNSLEIEIVNTWANRLIGDARGPEDQRVTRTNITRSGTPGLPWADLEPRPAGLFGPVTLVAIRPGPAPM